MKVLVVNSGSSSIKYQLFDMTDESAVKNGVSIDTSLGFGTVSGIVMGTRCGDLDPAIIP